MMTKGGILIVEDDKNIACAIEIGLQFYKIPCVICDNIEQAKELFLKIEPSIVLMDYWLNSNSVSDFVEFLRLSSNSSIQPKLILMSADLNIEKIAFNFDISNFIQKPFDLDQLLIEFDACLPTGQPWQSGPAKSFPELTLS